MTFASLLPSLRRWLDLLALTIVAILVCVLFYPVVQIISGLFAQSFKTWPTWLLFFITSLISGFLWFLLIRVGGFRWHDLAPYKLLRYPPVWFFSLMGLCAYCWLLFMFPLANYHTTSDSIDFKALGYVACSIVTGFAIASLFQKVFSGEMIQQAGITFQSAEPIGNFEVVLDNPDHLIQWLKQEVPIRHPVQDRFGLSIIAQRISRVLMLRELKTVGVIGQYGSGKSSLLNLVEYYLNNRRETFSTFQSVHSDSDFFYGELLICRVDGWGRTKGSIAEQILDIAISRLCREIDCLSVVSIPANYIEALTKAKGPFGILSFLLLNREDNPLKTLGRLDTLLRTAHMRLIIFLEDLDRNVSDDMIRDEMPALLDRLRHLENISFVLAIGTEHRYSNILIRICAQVETLT